MSEEISGKARGGFARAEVLAPEKRSEIAKKAAAVRWSGQEKILRSTHTGDLKVGVISIPCYVLDGGIRVLSRRGVNAAFTGAQGGGGARNSGGLNLPRILARAAVKPFISKELMAGINRAYEFQPLRGRTAFGFDAALLPMMCEAILDADRAGALKNHEAAKTAEILLRGLARVGIVALVDEATGYQEVRTKDALQVYLEKIIAKELAAWVKTFPDEFYENMYKLKGWTWPGMGKNRYSVVAHYTNDLVYDRIAPGLRRELETKNPKNEKGYRPAKNFQWLTAEIGHPMLAQHLYSLMMFQRLAIAQGYGWNRFVKMVDKVHPKKGSTLELPFDETDDLDD